MTASREAVARHRLPYEDSQPADTVIVVGEPSSGTRLVARMLEAGGVRVIHDERHGYRPWTSGLPVIVTRDPQSRAESVNARWPDGLDGFPTLAEHRVRYPDALEVRYEDVVADKDTVIVELAAALGVDPWLFSEDVYDANSEPGSRDA
jgi:hypothetical protein